MVNSLVPSESKNLSYRICSDGPYLETSMDGRKAVTYVVGFLLSTFVNKMLKSYKNIWSLNTEEAIVAGILRSETKKEVEVYIPLNAQMKDIDLVLINTKNKKTKAIQVKGSKAFQPSPTQIKNYEYGSFGWIELNKSAVDGSIADYFIFMIYVLEQFNKDDKGSVYIKPHTITIPKKELENKVKAYKKISGQKYRFHIWINPKTKEAFDFRDLKDKTKKKEDYSKFLDKEGFYRLNKELK